MKPLDAHTLEFGSLGDERGQLISLETVAQIPFQINRVYFIYANRDGVRRGFHAHRKLKQVAVCVNGACKFDLFDGVEKKTINLDLPTKGLYIGNVIWREIYDFSPNCVLMVIASEIYDETDYIRDYEQFMELARRFNS